MFPKMLRQGGRQQLGGRRRPRRRPEQPGGRDACWRPPGARRDAASMRLAGEAWRELGTRAGGGRPGARREPGEGTTCWRRWRASVRCRVPSGTAFYLRMCNDHTALGTIKLRKKLFCVGVGMYWEVFRSISMHCKRALLWKYMTLWTCRGSAPKLN